MKKTLLTFAILLPLLLVSVWVRYSVDDFSICTIIRTGTTEQTVDIVLTKIGHRKKITEWSAKELKATDFALGTSGIKKQELLHANELLMSLAKQKNTAIYWPTGHSNKIRVAYLVKYDNEKVQSIYNMDGNYAFKHYCN